jgi:hypothetical protein
MINFDNDWPLRVERGPDIAASSNGEAGSHPSASDELRPRPGELHATLNFALSLSCAFALDTLICAERQCNAPQACRQRATWRSGASTFVEMGMRLVGKPGAVQSEGITRRLLRDLPTLPAPHRRVADLERRRVRRLCASWIED